MDVEKTKSRRSSVSKIDTPIKKKIAISIEKREREASFLLEKLQTRNRPKSGPTHPAATGTGSTLSALRTEDVKTVKGIVKSAENLSGKGLLAADLIKNLQSQNTSSQRRGSQGYQSFVETKDATKSLSPRLCLTSAAKRQVKSARYKNTEEVSVHRLDVPRPKSEVSTRQPELTGDLLRRASLPSSDFRNKRLAAASILSKYKSANTLNSEAADKVSLPQIRKTGSANSICRESYEKTLPSRDNRDTISAKRRPLTPRETVTMPVKQQENVSKIVERAGDKERRDEKFRKKINYHESDQSSSSETESDSEKEQPDEAQRKKQTRVSQTKEQPKIIVSKKSLKSKEETKQKDSSDKVRKNDDKVEESDSHSDSDSEKDSSDDKSEDENDSDQESDSGIKENLKNETVSKLMIKDNEDSSESEDEDKADSGLVEDSLLANEELEKLSKEMVAPGMPAVDLQEMHEKLLSDGIIDKRRTKKRSEDDDEIAEDVDDLIDTIDDLLEADDEDIAYATKQEMKKKTFKSKVKMVITAERFGSLK